jgi:hypothetical protein
MANKNDIIIKLGVDLSSLQKDLQKSQKSFEAFGRKMQAVGENLSTYLTAPLAAFGVFSIKAAADLKDVESKFNLVFGNMADDTRKWADEFATSTNRAGGDLQKFLSGLQDTLVPMGAMPEAAQKMSKDLVSLAVDLASFNNMNDADVVRDLQAAITGSGEVMKKYGVILSQASVNQELLSMGISGGAKTATEAEKAQARYNIILRGTTAAQGNALATSNDFNNVLKGVVAEFGNLAEKIGNVFLPYAEKMLIWARDALRAFNSLDGGTTALVATIGLTVAALGPLLVSLGVITQTVIPALLGGMAAVRSAAVFMGNAFTVANLKIIAIPAAIVGLIVAGNALYHNWNWVVKWFDRSLDNLALWFVDAFLTMVDSVSGFASVFGIDMGSVRESLENTKASLIQNLDGKEVVEFGDLMTKVWEDMKTSVSLAASGIGSAISTMTSATATASGTLAGVNSANGTGSGAATGNQSGTPSFLPDLGSSGVDEVYAGIDAEYDTMIAKNEELALSFESAQMRTQTAVQSMAQSFGDNLGQMVTGAKSMKQALAGMVKGMITPLLNAAVQAVAAGEAIKFSWTGLGAIGAATAAAAIFTAVLNGLPAFEKGGFHSGGPMLVGEKGPEIVNTGSARVFNKEDTADILGMGGKNSGPGGKMELMVNFGDVTIEKELIRIAVEEAIEERSANFGV